VADAGSSLKGLLTKLLYCDGVRRGPRRADEVDGLADTQKVVDAILSAVGGKFFQLPELTNNDA